MKSPCLIFQQKLSRFDLSGWFATFEKRVNSDGWTSGCRNGVIQATAIRRQTRLESLANLPDECWQRIAKILIRPTAEAILSHHHPTAEALRIGVQILQLPTLRWAKQLAGPGEAGLP
jgi:hypothetical protein